MGASEEPQWTRWKNLNVCGALEYKKKILRVILYTYQENTPLYVEALNDFFERHAEQSPEGYRDINLWFSW